MPFAADYHELTNVSTAALALGVLLIWAGRTVRRKWFTVGTLISDIGGLAIAIGAVGVIASLPWVRHTANHHGYSTLQNVSMVIVTSGVPLAWIGRIAGRKWLNAGWIIFSMGGLTVFIGLIGLLASLAWPSGTALTNK
jgi:hypothetical protein